MEQYLLFLGPKIKAEKPDCPADRRKAADSRVEG
jgi:hypothetical protein